VVLAVDATGAQTDEIHNANVRDMQNISVRIMTTKDLVASL
jgi:nicotinamidase-related amidase